MCNECITIKAKINRKKRGNSYNMSYTEKEIIDDGNISDEEFERIYLPFHENFDEYMIRFVIPDAVAFYIANAYSRGCLDKCKLYNHINSAVDIFNCRCDIGTIIPTIE